MRMFYGLPQQVAGAVSIGHYYASGVGVEAGVGALSSALAVAKGMFAESTFTKNIATNKTVGIGEQEDLC
jgi:hypothetical protein